MAKTQNKPAEGPKVNYPKSPGVMVAAATGYSLEHSTRLASAIGEEKIGPAFKSGKLRELVRDHVSENK